MRERIPLYIYIYLWLAFTTYIIFSFRRERGFFFLVVVVLSDSLSQLLAYLKMNSSFRLTFLLLGVDCRIEFKYGDILFIYLYNELILYLEINKENFFFPFLLIGCTRCTY